MGNQWNLGLQGSRQASDSSVNKMKKETRGLCTGYEIVESGSGALQASFGQSVQEMMRKTGEFCGGCEFVGSGRGGFKPLQPML